MIADHVGIVVRDLLQSAPRFRALFPDAAYAEVFYEKENMLVGILTLQNLRLELLCPQAEDSPAGRFLAQHGEGIHHIAFSVSDLSQQFDRLQTSGFRTISDSPYPGADGHNVFFLHPRDTGSVLCEFCEE